MTLRAADTSICVAVRPNVFAKSSPRFGSACATCRPSRNAFLRKAQAKRSGLAFSEATLAADESSTWPCDVREFRNVVVHTTVIAGGGVISPEELAEHVHPLAGVTSPAVRCLLEHGIGHRMAKRDFRW